MISDMSDDLTPDRDQLPEATVSNTSNPPDAGTPPAAASGAIDHQRLIKGSLVSSNLILSHGMNTNFLMPLNTLRHTMETAGTEPAVELFAEQIAFMFHPMITQAERAVAVLRAANVGSVGIW
jgi:hypothetical protein